MDGWLSTVEDLDRDDGRVVGAIDVAFGSVLGYRAFRPLGGWSVIAGP